MNDRLPTHIWVDALLKTVFSAGQFATLVRRGDLERGSVVVRVVMTAQKHALLIPDYRADGGLAFVVYQTPTPATDPRVIEAYLVRLIDRDPDLWVVEIEARDGSHFITEPVTGMDAVLNPPQE